ncbi:hypothetical protein OIO90_006306 [Microbotryomycetes sp. JL221]|nr:hypothetical protein OIO90_006306 [Microbotryomycetes sp. JL221]
MTRFIHKVLLVWNEPTTSTPPFTVPQHVTIVANHVNSLNNRWVETLPLIDTQAVLVLDDDIQITSSAVECLLNVWRDHPNRLVGPFARRRTGNKYEVDELVAVKGSSYSFILPRVMVTSKQHLITYARPQFESHRRYVDTQDAHCDDLLLNSVATNSTGLPPLRVALPPGSLVDYATICGPLDRTQTSGLADQDSRWSLRSDCLRDLVGSEDQSLSTNQVAVCSDDGSSYVISPEGVSVDTWRSMSNVTAMDLCPELATGLGQMLQHYCPETHEAMSEWIDAVVNFRLCDGSSKQALIDSAKFQCGSWCLWDLRTRSKRGWRLTPPCFFKFDSTNDNDVGSQCDEWFYQRPNVDL